MPATPTASIGLPKGIFAALRHQAPPIRVSPRLLATASVSVDQALQQLNTRLTGLTTDEAAARLAESGPNIVDRCLPQTSAK